MAHLDSRAPDRTTCLRVCADSTRRRCPGPAFAAGTSRFLGYGGVEDVAASSMPGPAVPLPRVTFYTASACPFCPLVRDRLAGLQKTLGFEMEEVDVTFRPDLIRAKGLRSVPVVEAGAEILVGNATSQQLAAFLQRAAAAAPTA